MVNPAVARAAPLFGLACLALGLSSPGAIGAPQVDRGADCLRRAYPEHICAVEDNTLVWCDGTRMTYDAGLTYANHEDLLDRADPKAQMAQRYLPGRDFPIPPVNFEPGRIRHEPFFKKMYGATAREVSRHTRPVEWLPGSGNRTMPITTINKVHEKLAAVSAEVARLPAATRGKVQRSSGGFVWRTIKGSDRLSMHSFAIAVDVGVENSDYWKWSAPRDGGPLTWRNRIPLEVVEIFERHGFVWGGKWHHYDTMHFEYRPELLIDGCVQESP